MNDDVKTVIRDFVVSTYLQGESPDNLRDETSLITSGILDSLAVLGFVSFLEQRFSVELDVYDTSIERFDRIMDIAATVCLKQEAHAVKVVRR
jgi:acyl carrier protein